MKIHPNKETALTALREYREALNMLSEKFGVSEECEDSCCAIYTTVRFYGSDGETVCKLTE